MITLRRAEERGHANHGWLNSYHTFSFADYYDPKHMGFRSLRVLNDDRVAPGMGFGAHGHRDMEILSYVLEGKVAHKDSTGENAALGVNEVQVMSAGTGVIHSEFNGSSTEPTHFLQIWIVPNQDDLRPSYQQFKYDPAEKHGKLRLIASPAGGDGSDVAKINAAKINIAKIHQDAQIFASVLTPGETVDYKIPEGRYAWVHCAEGNITVNGTPFKEGDGAAVSDEKMLSFAGAGELGGEFLVFDLA